MALTHFKLKFNHAVEIGAYHAYVGHYKRTNDPEIFQIAQDEVDHRAQISNILSYYNTSSNYFLDIVFTLIGKTIGFLCRISPLFMLDRVATTMENFAIYNYNQLAKEYPGQSITFLNMAHTEWVHKIYFKYKENLRPLVRTA